MIWSVSMTRAARFFGVILLVAGLPHRAAADPAAGGDAQLPASLKAGAEASRSKKWEACIDAYSRAAAIEESAVTFGELGLCEEAAGQFASAHPHLKQAVAGLAPGDVRRTRYQAALGRVSDQVAIVIVTVTPTEARLVVDGRPLGRGEGRNVAVMPGKHVFSARLPGHKDASKTLTVNARELPHLELTLEPLPSTDVSAASSAVPRVASSVAPTSSASSTAPIVLSPAIEGAAGASLPVPLRWCVPAWSARGVLGPAACIGVLAVAASGGTAIGLTAHAQSMRDSLVARGYTATSCTAGELASSPECDELRARRLQRDTARDVLIGTGVAAGVLVAMAGVAIALEPLGPRPARVTAAAGADGGGIVVQGSW